MKTTSIQKYDLGSLFLGPAGISRSQPKVGHVLEACEPIIVGRQDVAGGPAVEEVVALLVKPIGDQLRTDLPVLAVESVPQPQDGLAEAKSQPEPEQLEEIIGEVVHRRPPQGDLDAVLLGFPGSTEDFDLEPLGHVIVLEVRDPRAGHLAFDEVVAAEASRDMGPLAGGAVAEGLLY